MNNLTRARIAEINCKHEIYKMLEIGIEHGLPDTPVARFEFSCCILLTACYASTVENDTPSIEQIIDYISEHRNLLPDTPNYSKAEMKAILMYRKLLFCSMEIKQQSIYLADIIEAATKYGHLSQSSEIKDIQIRNTDYTHEKCFRTLTKLFNDTNISNLTRELIYLSPFSPDRKPFNEPTTTCTTSLTNNSTQLDQTTQKIVLRNKKQNSDSEQSREKNENKIRKNRCDDYYFITRSIGIIIFIIFSIIFSSIIRTCNKEKEKIERNEYYNSTKQILEPNKPSKNSSSQTKGAKRKQTEVKKTRLSPNAALKKAIEKSDEIAAKEAIDNGADVNKLTLGSKKNYSALQFAILSDDYEMSKLLIDNGADIFISTPNFSNLWSIIAINNVSKSGEKIIKLLLDKGLNPNIPAVIKINDQLLQELTCLVDKEYEKYQNNSLGVDFNKTKTDLINKYKTRKKVETLIIKHCVICGCKETVDYLLSKGAKPDIETPDTLLGGSSLSIAARKGYTDIMELLLKHGARVDELEPLTFATPLHTAVSQRHYTAAEILLKNGADVNKCSEAGTALHIAALNGDTSMLKLLIKYGGNINHKSTIDGSLPLRMALLNGRYEAASFLIKEGSNITEPDYEGISDNILILLLAEDDATWKLLLTNQQLAKAMHALKMYQKQKYKF